jgi:two-component sensor histidine kinase
MMSAPPHLPVLQSVLNASLRTKLVLLVAVAMVPPGLLAVMEARSNYQRGLTQLEQNLTLSAQLAANEANNLLSNSRQLLRSLALQPEIKESRAGLCRRTLDRAITGLDQYQGAMVINQKGEVTCSSSTYVVPGDIAISQWFGEVMHGESFVLSDLLPSTKGGLGLTAAVPLLDDAGAVIGAVTLFTGVDWLTTIYSRVSLPAHGAAFALLDRSGEVISSAARYPDVANGLPLAKPLREEVHDHARSFTALGRDGERRLYAISPLVEGRIFVVMGVPSSQAMNPLTLQFASGVVTPLLMWSLATLVVWFGIERLVVRWITYLERITSAYAAGRHNVRPERVRGASKEIRSLGETFARMADLISAREAELRESLAQKEILVREIHHRVKNNLQLVMSLLNLHARRIKDPQAEMAFAEARGRINALATLHRRLYESEKLEHVDLKWFLEDLCGELRRSGFSSHRTVDLVVTVPNAVISSSTAVPLGLLVTEAITNAYKHAFIGRNEGRIEVTASELPDNQICVRVRDNGVGFDPEGHNHEAPGLGRSLIEAFARQLRAKLEVTRDNGTSLQLCFPLLPNLPLV